MFRAALGIVEAEQYIAGLDVVTLRDSDLGNNATVAMLDPLELVHDLY
jgi:hypothetical protein